MRKFALSGLDDRTNGSRSTDLLLPRFQRRLSDLGTGFTGFETDFGRVVLGKLPGRGDGDVGGGLLALVETPVLGFVDGVGGRCRRRRRRF